MSNTNKEVFEKCKACEFFNKFERPYMKCSKHGYLIDLDGSIKVDCPLLKKQEVLQGGDNIRK